MKKLLLISILIELMSTPAMAGLTWPIGAPNSTHEEWSFDNQSHPLVPDGLLINPYGTPTAEVLQGAYIYGPIEGRVGLYWDEPAYICFYVPNTPITTGYKDIYVKVYAKFGPLPGQRGLSITTDPDWQQSLILEDNLVPLGNNWYEWNYGIRVWPNPQSEIICIYVLGTGGWLDKVVIDTQCVPAPGVRVLHPNGGEVFTAGSTYPITWSSVGSISDVLIEYSTDNGSNWTAVDPPNAGNSGSYNWLVPAVNSTQCLVRVSDANNSDVNDISDDVFTIRRVMIYVDNDAPNDPEPNNPDVSDPLEDGLSEHPFDAIQKAIDVSMDSDTVVVLPGTYTGNGNRDIDFLGRAITVRCIDPNDPNVVAATVIDCNGTEAEPHRGFYFHSSEDANSVIQGFTITKGYFRYGCGGAILCDLNSSPIIVGNTVTGNLADMGGGISCWNSSCPTIRGNRIMENTSVYNAGGIECYSASPEIINNVIVDNLASEYGGGIACWSSSLPQVINNTVAENTAEKGGGISCYDSAPIIQNCIFWANEASEGPQVYINASISINYCNIQGDWPGWGNINADPLFVDPNNGDFHLLPDSPCINAGDPNYQEDANEFDIDGNRRIIGGRIDIGADEYSYGEFCDLNKDGIVNFYDFAILAYYWMEHSCMEPDLCAHSDFDHNGRVDMTDLKTFAENWLGGE